MNKQQAKGYLLEIVLSKLIEVNGYEVIREHNIPYEYSVPYEEQEIVSNSNGLNVRGRGGYHQFDTLGTFKITPPFVYPLRLFVEAKCYASTKVGIDRVRMGVGVLNDVNTNYATVDLSTEQLSIKRYQYHYAIFSTSGFSKPAQRYAIAHKIHLIDLSNDAYKGIINLIEQIVDELMDNSDIDSSEFNNFKNLFSELIYDGYYYHGDNKFFVSDLLHLVRALKRNIENQFLYLATINSVHMIPLLANSEFNELLKSNPHQNVSIHFNPENPDEWIIVPIIDNDEVPNLSISFTLPELLREYIYQDVENAMLVKEKFIHKFVFIAYVDNDNPTICTLTFNKATTMENPWSFR